MPKEKADMVRTSANITEAKKKIDYAPKISLKVGIKRFIKWHQNYYRKKKL